MNEVLPGITVKRPNKPRFIRVICRHGRGERGWQTHEFPNRLVIRYHGLGPHRDLSVERKPRPGEHGIADLGEPGTYRYKCPRCHRDLQLRAENMLRLIDAVDALERQRTGDPASRVQRLDITAAEDVLRFRRQASEAPQGRLAAADAPRRERVQTRPRSRNAAREGQPWAGSPLTTTQ